MRLQGLLRPKSIAVVGASPNSFVGTIAIDNSRQLGFKGVLSPVSPTHVEVSGIVAVRSLGDLEEIPELVVIQVSTARVLGLVSDALSIGVRNFVIPGGGITDSGDDAVALDAGLRKLRGQYEFDVVGPNSMGVLDLVSGAAPYVGTVPQHVRKGSVGVVAQSGAVVELVVNAGGRIPVSTLVSAGGESTTGLPDYIDFFREDPHTTAVIVFIEGFEDAHAFLESARRFVASGKHLAATVVGRSAVSRDGISAHSGKLAPSARITAAALAQAGVHVADDLDELLAFGEIFGTGNLPRGNRVHVVTNSGGEGNLLADLAEDAGLDLPAMSASAVNTLTASWPRFTVRNPLDPWGVDDYEAVYPAAVRVAAQEAGDILVISQDQQQTSGEHERTLGLHLAQYLAREHREPVVPVLLSPTSQDPDPEITAFCRDNGITHLRGARQAFSALGKLVRLRTVDGHAGTLLPVEDPILNKVGPLIEDESLALLRSLGVRVPRQARVSNAEDAVTAAAVIDGPVVVKGVVEDLWHKSELGLVEVGLHDGTAVHAAANRVLDNAAAAGLEVDLLVAEMARGDLDVYVGYKRDPQFGHTLVLGVGGIWTEHLDLVDVYVGLLDEELATRWIAATRVGRMLSTARGGSLPADDLITALVAVSRIANHDSTVAAIDINPVMVGRDGGVAVDAAIQRTSDLRTSRPTTRNQERT